MFRLALLLMLVSVVCGLPVVDLVERCGDDAGCMKREWRSQRRAAQLALGKASKSFACPAFNLFNQALRGHLEADGHLQCRYDAQKTGSCIFLAKTGKLIKDDTGSRACSTAATQRAPAGYVSPFRCPDKDRYPQQLVAVDEQYSSSDFKCIYHLGADDGDAFCLYNKVTGQIDADLNETHCPYNALWR